MLHWDRQSHQRQLRPFVFPESDCTQELEVASCFLCGSLSAALGLDMCGEIEHRYTCSVSVALSVSQVCRKCAPHCMRTLMGRPLREVI